ncbi:MAG: VOC family protein [Acidimicrobiia bacterium]|nr:VOC family protein [Acidimicrobiia bacterium]MDH5502550.1 VOC family protein [Acidimicrobiia bacterium]
MATPIQIVFDANDPALLAEFWALALGYIVQPPPDGFTSWAEWATAMEIPEEHWNDASAVVDPEGIGPRIFFQRVPEGKTAKNRLHLDVNAGGGHDVPIDDRRVMIDAQVARLMAAGASTVGQIEQRGEYWVVLTDPEGNEFCVQ